jgi:DNA-binding NarL/FixJ family response regulator
MRVLVSASDPLVRAGVGAVLHVEADVEVVDSSLAGPANSGDSGRLPDVALIFVSDLARHERPGVAGPPVVALLRDGDPLAAIAALRAGAVGLHCLSCHLAELPTAARVVAAGGGRIADCVALALAGHLGGRTSPVRLIRLAGLSPREAAVLRLIAEGVGNAEIARRLGIDVRTVRYYASSMFGKLDVRNRAEAIALAFRRGLVA